MYVCMYTYLPCPSCTSMHRHIRTNSINIISTGVGKVVHVDLLVDTSGRPKGCASVQFETTAEAMNAISILHTSCDHHVTVM